MAGQEATAHIGNRAALGTERIASLRPATAVVRYATAPAGVRCGTPTAIERPGTTVAHTAALGAELCTRLRRAWRHAALSGT